MISVPPSAGVKEHQRMAGTAIQRNSLVAPLASKVVFLAALVDALVRNALAMVLSVWRRRSFVVANFWQSLEHAIHVTRRAHRHRCLVPFLWATNEDAAPLPPSDPSTTTAASSASSSEEFPISDFGEVVAA